MTKACTISQYNQTLQAINEARYILIVTHLNPDADTIASSLALSNYLTENKKKHKVFNKDRYLPRNLDFLPLFNKITHLLPKFFDLIIYIDCGDKERVGIDFDDKVTSINIDHHQSNKGYGTYNFIDISKSSTAEVLFDFFEKNNIILSKNSAECFYTAIYDDSLKFSAPRVDRSTFEKVSKLLETKIDPSYIAEQLNRRDSLAKYRVLPRILDSLELHFEGRIATIYLKEEWLKQSGATIKECDDAIDLVLNIKIVDIVIFARVINSKTRLSLRSKNNIHVNRIAEQFNGGGHSMAAGCSHESTNIDLVLKEILEFCKKEYKL